MFRHLQSVMDLRIVVEKLRHLGQHRFDLLIAGTCSSERHDAYSAAKLVADSAVQLVQQQLLLRRGELGRKRRHNVHPANFRWVFSAGGASGLPPFYFGKNPLEGVKARGPTPPQKKKTPTKGGRAARTKSPS